MIKVVLIDADGIVVTGKRFTDRLFEDYGISPNEVMLFFKNEFKQCTLGRLDLKEELEKCMSSWGWRKSADELLDFWFSGDEVQEQVLAVIDRLKNAGVACYLVSDNEKHRARYLMTKLGLGKRFDGAFFSCDLGYKKSDKQFFKAVLKHVSDIKPEEIFYWDDDEKNVEIANGLGIQGKLYTSFGDFERATMGSL